MGPELDPKLCLSCARRSLAGQPPKPCGACPLLNVDPLAQVRANSVRPSPMLRYDHTVNTAILIAREQAAVSGGRAQPRATSWERGE